MKKFWKDLLAGIEAGAAIALGGILNVIAKAYIPDPYGKLIGALLFPVGLTLVCFLSLGLFTGKIGYVFDNDKKYLPYLGTIYLGNFIGSFVVGLIMNLATRKTKFFSSLLKIAQNKAYNVQYLDYAFNVFTGALFCGALVYLAVYAYKNAKQVWLKVVGIFLAIALFVYAGFDHCIANMFYFVGGFGFKGFANGYTYLNILIVTFGNSLGAITLNTVLRKKTS